MFLLIGILICPESLGKFYLYIGITSCDYKIAQLYNNCNTEYCTK